MRIPFRELATRITGVSTPVFGVSWEPPTLDTEVAKAFVTFLEDRRVLFNPYQIEVPEHCTMSVIEIRRRLTRDLEQLGDSSELAESMRAMRAGCRAYLDRVGGEATDRPGDGWPRQRHVNWLSALIDLRATFGLYIARIAVAHGIDVEEQLVSMFPPSDSVAED